MIPAYPLGHALLVFAGVGIALLELVCGISWLVRPMPKRPGAEETYECGMPAEGGHRNLGFNFIGYAVLFLVFDLAALYLFLYAVAPSRESAITLIVGIAILCVMILYGTRKRRYYVA